MKYIKLFESFESSKITKTMGYIDKDSRGYFFRDIRKLCSAFDFPLSKLNDNIFQYLQFKKALNLKADKKGEIRWVKFWFSSSGKYLETTLVNGEKSHIERNNFENGQKVKINLDDLLPEEDGVIEIEGKEVVLLSNSFGHSVDDPSENKGYSYRANLGYRGDVINLSIFGQSPNDIKISPINGYEHELLYNAYYDEIGISKYKNSQINIKDASFALVLDFSKFIGLTYDKKNYSRSTIKRDRMVDKTGAFMSDKMIRDININRYLNKLTDRLKDFDSIKNVFLTILGGKTMFFDILGDSDVSSKFISYVYNFLSATSEVAKKDLLDDIKRIYIRKYKINLSRSRSIDKHTRSLKKSANTEEKREFLDKILELNELVYKKFSGFKIETLADMLVISDKVSKLGSYAGTTSPITNSLISPLIDYFIGHNSPVISEPIVKQYSERLDNFKKILKLV